MVLIEQLQDRLQGSFTPSYIPNNHSMAESLNFSKEEPHMMVENEVHVDMQVIEEDTFKQEGNLQSLGGGT